MILKSLLNLVIGADFLFEIWVDGVQGDALPDKNDQGGEKDTQCDPADVSVFFHFDAPHRDGLLSGGGGVSRMVFQYKMENHGWEEGRRWSRCIQDDGVVNERMWVRPVPGQAGSIGKGSFRWKTIEELVCSVDVSPVFILPQMEKECNDFCMQCNRDFTGESLWRRNREGTRQAGCW